MIVIDGYDGPIMGGYNCKLMVVANNDSWINNAQHGGTLWFKC